MKNLLTNAEQPMVSVIIPVYNTEAYIADCLESITNGSFRDLEIICINDGSTDNSSTILQEFAEKDDRILLIEQKNSGVSAARNAGLEAAEGKYIAFVDSDDYVHPQFLELLMKTALSEDADVVACDFLSGSEKCYNWAAIDSGTVKAWKGMKLPEIINRHHLKSHVWGRVYKKPVIANLYFDEEIRFAEDTAFNLTALCRCEKLFFTYVQVPLYYYFNDREGSAIHSIKPVSLLTGAERVYLPLYDTFGENKTIILEQAIRSLLSCRFLNYFTPDEYTEKKCRELLKEARGYLKDFPVKKRLRYGIFIRFPYIYRCFRIYKDPSMGKWERNVKKARRAERRGK